MTSKIILQNNENVCKRDIFGHKYRILELYPDVLNVYGDGGNAFTLASRARKFGLDFEIVSYNLGDVFPDLNDFDIMIGSGGSDNSQSLIKDDLLLNKKHITKAIDEGLPALLICGMYQLFGSSYETRQGEQFEGLGIFNMVTVGKNVRLIGNIVTQSSVFGEIIGFENHAGQSFLNDKSALLAESVKLGTGNNATKNGEGYLYKHAIGTYLHGPLLPKNPQISDWLIEKAVNRRNNVDSHFNDVYVDRIDELANLARIDAIKGGR